METTETAAIMIPRNIISALRFALSISFSFFAAKYFAFQNPYWAPTTIIIVEGINYGSFSGKILPRFSGNLVGGAIGLAILSVFLQIPVLYALVISVFSAVLVYKVLNQNHPLFWRWVLIAGLIITFYNIDHPHNAFSMGMDRVACVSVGLLINFLFHQLFYFQSAHKDYLDDIAAVQKDLQEIAEEKAKRLLSQDTTPVENAADILEKLKLLATGLEHAFRDNREFQANRQQHLRLLCYLQDIAHALCYLATEKGAPQQTETERAVAFYLQKTSAALAACQVSATLSFPEAPSFSPHAKETFPDSDFRVITARTAFSKACAIFEIPGKALPEDTTPANTRHPNYRANAHTAFLAGTALFTGMMVWRFTGWPGGMVMPLLSMLFILYFQMFPTITMRALVILQVVSLMGAMAISFFILPVIHSSQFFFIFFTILFFFFGLLMHSPNASLRGVGMMLAVLVNSCANGYQATFFSFTVMTTYGLLILGANLIAIFLLLVFHKNDALENCQQKALEILLFFSPQQKNETAFSPAGLATCQADLEEMFAHARQDLDKVRAYHLSMLVFGTRTALAWNSNALTLADKTAIHQSLDLHLQHLTKT